MSPTTFGIIAKFFVYVIKKTEDYLFRLFV